MNLLELYSQRKVVVLHDSESVRTAALAMRARHIGCVLVANREGSVYAMVTDRDLMVALLEPQGDQLPLTQLAQSKLYFVNEGAELCDVVEQMKQYGVRRIPVIREYKNHIKKCVGMVTLDDLIAGQAIPPAELAEIVKAQIFSRYRPTENPSAKISPFLKDLARHFVHKEGDLNEFARRVLQALFRRLHYSAAISFMLQLPIEYQDDFIQLPAGPDRSISASTLEREVCYILKMKENEVPEALQKLWTTLRNFGDPEVLQNVMNQLPEDIQNLFMMNLGPLRLFGDDLHA